MPKLKKLTYLSLILVSLCIFSGAVGVIYWHINKPKEEYIFKEYEVSPLTLVLDWVIEKPFELQVFYTVDEKPFDEKNSIRKWVYPKDKHIEVIFPVSEINGLRLDFGSNPDKIVIKNIEVKADHFENFNIWHNWKFVNIDEKSFDDKDLTLVSKQSDPNIVYSRSIYLSENTDLAVLKRENKKIKNSSFSEPTLAKIVVSAKLRHGVMPVEVYLNGSNKPLPTIASENNPKERLIIIEQNATESTLDIKTQNSFSKYNFAFIKPENDEKYIKCTSFKFNDLTLIHPKVPEYISSQTPIKAERDIKKEFPHHYEIKWSKVHALSKQN